MDFQKLFSANRYINDVLHRYDSEAPRAELVCRWPNNCVEFIQTTSLGGASDLQSHGILGTRALRQNNISEQLYWYYGGFYMYSS